MGRFIMLVDAMAKQKGATYSVKLTGPGMAIETPLSEDVAKRIAMIVFTKGQVDGVGGGPVGSVPGMPTVAGAVQAPVQLVSPAQQPSVSSKPQLSLREFLTDCNAVRIPEKVVSIGFYLEQNGKAEGFAKSDLIKGFELAKEPIPGNLSRDITWTVKLGWIAHKHENEDLYYVTKSGAKAVESKFPDELRKKTKVSAGGRKRKQNETTKK